MSTPYSQAKGGISADHFIIPFLGLSSKKNKELNGSRKTSSTAHMAFVVATRLSGHQTQNLKRALLKKNSMSDEYSHIKRNI